MPDNIRFSNPDTMQKPPGYSHVVEVTGDDLGGPIGCPSGCMTACTFPPKARCFPEYQE